MKYVLMMVLFINAALNVDAQFKKPIKSQDELMPNSIFSQIDDHIRNSKPYLRHRWFYEQRAFPNEYIPEDAYKNSIDQKSNLSKSVTDQTYSATHSA